MGHFNGKFLAMPPKPKHLKCIWGSIDTGTHFPIYAQGTNLCCVKKSGGLCSRKIQKVDFKAVAVSN